jgi:NTP pyrophosphatase (non-canonical NTP hydrolase)
LVGNTDLTSVRTTYFDLDALQTRAFAWCAKVNVSPKDVQRLARRFIEEAVELVQALGLTREKVLHIVNYVFDRAVGEVKQEIGGVGMTLLPLCEALDVSAEQCFRTELRRIDTPCMITKIRLRQAAKDEAGL